MSIKIVAKVEVYDEKHTRLVVQTIKGTYGEFIKTCGEDDLSLAVKAIVRDTPTHIDDMLNTPHIETRWERVVITVLRPAGE